MHFPKSNMLDLFETKEQTKYFYYMSKCDNPYFIYFVYLVYYVFCLHDTTLQGTTQQQRPRPQELLRRECYILLYLHLI